MPKYVALLYGDEAADGGPDEMTEHMEFNASNADFVIGGEALHPTSTAKTVRLEGGKGGQPVFTDGPFAETKEALGGFYLLEAPDLDAALDVAQQIPSAWRGTVEVRPVMEFDEEGNPIN